MPSTLTHTPGLDANRTALAATATSPSSHQHSQPHKTPTSTHASPRMQDSPVLGRLPADPTARLLRLGRRLPVTRAIPDVRPCARGACAVARHAGGVSCVVSGRTTPCRPRKAMRRGRPARPDSQIRETIQPCVSVSLAMECRKGSDNVVCRTRSDRGDRRGSSHFLYTQPTYRSHPFAHLPPRRNVCSTPQRHGISTTPQHVMSTPYLANVRFRHGR